MAQLSTLDLLFLSEREQDVVRCLAGQPGLMLSEIAQRLQLSAHDLEETITRMVGDARLTEQLSNGQRIFSVRFKREPQRVRSRNSSLFGSFDQASD